MRKNNKKLLLPVLILIATVLVILASKFLSAFLGISERGTQKVFEIVKAFSLTSVSFVMLLLIDAYKGSVSRFWYWIFNIGLTLVSISCVLNFIELYIRYYNSIINRMYEVATYLQALISAQAVMQYSQPRFISLITFINVLLLIVLVLIYIVKNFNLPVIRLVIHVQTYLTNKINKYHDYKNVSLGFLYNTIP